MKLSRAIIYGFGKWVDDEIDFSDSICIYGENESGKSTIHQFILFMLFGMPPKQREFYRPKTGAQIGGRLMISDVDGDFIIERLDTIRNGNARCFTPDGAEHDESWLKERLKGMTIESYQSIYSFSALDLHTITKMKEEDLGEILLGIGLSGSTEIHAVEKKLDQRLGDLFKPYGRKPVINQQLEKLDKHFSSLQEFKANEGTYRIKKEEEEALDSKLNNLKDSLTKDKKHLIELEKQLQALPFLQDYEMYQSRLNNYEVDSTFPENGVNRLEELKQSFIPFKSELAILNENQEKYEQKILQIKEQQMESPVYEKAEALLKLKLRYTEYKNELDRVEATLNQKQAKLESEINRLNVGLKREHLAQMSFPFHLEKLWVQLKEKSDQLKREWEEIKTEENQLKQARNYIFNEIQELEEQLLPENEVQMLRSEISNHQEQYLLEKLHSEANLQRKGWREKRLKKEKQMTVFLIISMLIAAAAGGLAIFSDNSLFFDLMVIILVIGFGQWMWGKYHLKEMDHMIGMESGSHAERIVSKSEISKIEEQLAYQNQLLSELSNLEERLKDNDKIRLHNNDRAKAIAVKKEKLHEQVEIQRKNYPFLRNVDITYWQELFHAIKYLLELHQEISEVIHNVEHLHQQIGHYQTELNQFFKERGWDVPEQIEAQLELLESQVKKQQELERTLYQYTEELTDNHNSREEVIQKIRAYENEMKGLFHIANVTNEEEYYLKAKCQEEEREWKEALERTILQLERILPKGEWRKLIEKELDEKTLEWEIDVVKRDIQQKENELDIVNQQLADSHASLSLLESSNSYSTSLHQFEMEQDELNKLAEEWAVLKTAKEVLLKTKRAYRENYLSRVVDKTSTYFCKLTGNKYSRVYAPAEKEYFQVESENGVRYMVHELSKGTIDQLYISLRLAISEAMSEHHRLPFIVDDAFIHFDSIRTTRMVEIMEEISTRQQVILFTCKDQVTNAVDSMNVLRLSQAQEQLK
ncbi:ATP-binding protein [Oceanobacillus senegalensis]|uniref:ATP-binding protein n=1 Tax=Oceanobacillus senegalensis TaxID=1936063 RepID=UPI000A30572E|nr:AAA family ATPase [Oceanobacillus senegalensis]